VGSACYANLNAATLRESAVSGNAIRGLSIYTRKTVVLRGLYHVDTLYDYLESGLDSLSFALIVARLEDSLGFDPFDTDEEMKFPVTFGDFVKLYENHSK